MTAPARAIAWASGDSGRDPGEDRVLDRLGDAGLADRRAVGPRLGAQRPEQLLDVERDPVGPLVDGGRDIARGRQAGVEDQRRDERRLGGIERDEPDLLGDPLGDQPRAPLAKARPARHVLGPVVAGQQEAAIARPAGELGDDLEAHVVGPLEVLEDEHRRSGQRAEDQLDGLHRPAAAAGRARPRGPPCRARGARSPSVANAGRRTIDRARSRMDAAGTSWSCGATAPSTAANPRLSALRPDGAEEARLADPGLAGQQQELAVPGEDVVQAAVGELEQVVPPDEERACSGARRAAHGRPKCRTGSAPVIGHSTDDALRRPASRRCRPIRRSARGPDDRRRGGTRWRNSWMSTPGSSG